MLCEGSGGTDEGKLQKEKKRPSKKGEDLKNKKEGN